jgi:hypothetical protein
MMKATGLRPVMGFAIYRPDGTVQRVFEQSMRLTADQRANLLAWAFREDIKDHSRSGHPTTPADTIAAKKGYRVVRVTISPTH